MYWSVAITSVLHNIYPRFDTTMSTWARYSVYATSFNAVVAFNEKYNMGINFSLLPFRGKSPTVAERGSHRKSVGKN